MRATILFPVLLCGLAMAARAAELKPEIAHVHPDEPAIKGAPLLITGEHFDAKSQVASWRPPGEAADVLESMKRLGEPQPRSSWTCP